eukprot:3187593-Prorocentrum_lima.AAC.1
MPASTGTASSVLTMVTPSALMQTWGKYLRNTVEAPRAPMQTWEEEYYSTEEEGGHYDPYDRWEWVYGLYGW